MDTKSRSWKILQKCVSKVNDSEQVDKNVILCTDYENMQERNQEFNLPLPEEMVPCSGEDALLIALQHDPIFVEDVPQADSNENICISDDHNASSFDEYQPESSEDDQSTSNDEQDKSPNVSTKRIQGGRKKVDEPMRRRKRNRKPENWESSIRKKNRTSGKSYVTIKGQVMSEKRLKPPCQCRRKCSIPETTREKIFSEFYQLSIEAQNQFISDSVTEERKHTERLRSTKSESRRKFSRKYKLDDKEVCKTMFTNTLDVGLMKIRVILDKRRNSWTSICPPDRRGKHGNHVKMSDTTKNAIMDHINKFPSYESHYSRRHSAKKYLSGELSVSKMYRLYETESNEAERRPICESAYRKVFVENFNLGFKNPKNDTCHRCDKFKLLLDTADPEKKGEIQAEYHKHLESAEKLYDEKKNEKQRSFADSKIAFVCFDLQQCLPTPLLRSGLAFYKRSLWTFNLTTFSIVNQTQQSNCYMWDETIAQRGGQEIASCILKLLKSLPDDVEEVNIYSDCCGGQTRNIYFSVMCILYMADLSQSAKKLKVINHKYLIPGHTHMEADSIHAIIEKAKKTQTTVTIDLPRDWMNLIRTIYSKNPINVIEMTRNDFFKFSAELSTRFVHRKINSSGQPVDWLNIRWIQYRRNEVSTMFYKKSIEDSASFLELHLKRKRCSYRHSSNQNYHQLELLYHEPLLLPRKKVEDLLSILDFIHPCSRAFYQSLDSNEQAIALGPWPISDDEV